MLTFTKTWQILRCFSFETQDNTHIIDKNCQSNTLAAFLCKPLWSTCTVCKYMVVYRPARGGFGLELMVKRSKVRDLMCLFLRIIIHWVCCDFWFALCVFWVFFHWELVGSGEVFQCLYVYSGWHTQDRLHAVQSLTFQAAVLSPFVFVRFQTLKTRFASIIPHKEHLVGFHPWIRLFWIIHETTSWIFNDSKSRRGGLLKSFSKF